MLKGMRLATCWDIPAIANKQSTMAEEYICACEFSDIIYTIPKAMMLQEKIQQTTIAEATLQCLIHLTQT